MSPRTKLLHFLFFVWTGFIEAGISQPPSFPKVTLADTEVRKLKSNYVKDMEYDIHIALPPDYKSSNQAYPVVYFTDAFYWGGIVIETYRLLRAFNEIPPMILVGISWDPDDQKGLSHRARDFTPTVVPFSDLPEWLKPFTPTSGGAAPFLSFIEKELIPFVENNYRADPANRGILGYSYGGLFSAYVLFSKPHLFQNYLIGAPTLCWDDYYVLKEEEKFYETTQELPAKVFSAIGSEDFADLLKSWISLRDRLGERKYKKMKWMHMVLDGENHTSAIPAIYSRAFRFLYGND